jgi:signal peptidase I
VAWALDHFLLRRWRESLARAAGREPAAISEPGTVDYARSFFPVAAVLLVLRSFMFEPYRIPSDSMMPTLLDGDFIVVNKYSYGLRWPVSHKLFYEVGRPQRGTLRSSGIRTTRASTTSSASSVCPATWSRCATTG